MQKTLERFFYEVRWPIHDWTVIDLPPGTGDVPIALAQLLGRAHAILVTTSQELALQDAFRAAHSWYQLGVQLEAVVENMSGFQDHPELPPLFGPSRLEEIQQRLNAPLGIKIPFVFDIRSMEERGCPIAFKGRLKAPWFFELAEKLIQRAI